MLAAKLTSRGNFIIQAVPEPVIRQPDEVLLKMVQVGICGSDLHYFRQGGIGDQIVTYPFTIGHEAIALIQEVGPDVKELKPGDKIVIDPAITCGRCDQCLAGRPHTCRHLKFLGCPGQQEGCLQEYLVLPEKNCFVIEVDLFPLGVLVEPLAIALYAAQMAGSLTGKRVAIFGCGPIGLGLILHCHLSGAKKIVATDKVQARLDEARRLGANWVGNPDRQEIVAALSSLADSDSSLNSSENIERIKDIFGSKEFDLAFDCCGDQQALHQAVSILKPGGQLIIIGIPETDQIYFDPHILRRKEITIFNVRRQNNFFPQAMAFLKAQKNRLKSLITHHFPLKDIQRAFDIASNYKDGVIKAVIDLS